VGAGIWIDAEADIEDNGLRLIPPIVGGAVAPLGVFLVDRLAFKRGMPEGLPSAVATGMLVGAGEGLGVASYQWVTADEADEWGFRGLARAEILGATVGGAAGVGLYYAIKPAPESNILIASGAFWGTAVGSFFGGGASNGDWGQANDGTSLGGLIGFNVGLAGAVGSSIFWTPSWNQLGWMWGGMALGTAITLPVYFVYLGSDDDPRRGMIVQGVGAIIGLGAGIFIGEPRRQGGGGPYAERDENPNADIEDSFVRLHGASLMPVNQGAGLQLTGELW
jgi:hypothetical protein